MAMKGAALPQAMKSLAERLHPSWVNGRWREAEISARKRAKLRKETLLAGGYAHVHFLNCQQVVTDSLQTA